MQSIVFACNKFHEFISRKQFGIYNYHLPLNSIFNKTILKAPPRVQRFYFDYNAVIFTMNFVKGLLLTVTNTLTRAPLKKNRKSEIDNAEITSRKHIIELNYLISGFSLQPFKDEIKFDN